MGLYERLCGEEEPKLPVHQFYAVVAEVQRGQITAATGALALGLDAAEQVEVGVLVARVTGGFLTHAEVEQVLMLGEFQLVYTTAADVKARLGV
jgi:hypothetical protein